VRKFRSKKKTLVISVDASRKPYYLSSEYSTLRKKFANPESIQFCQYNPFLGLIPLEISDIFPSAHYVTSRIEFNPKDFPIFLKTWKIFFEKNHFTSLYYDMKDEFLKYFMKTVPNKIRKKSLN